MVNALCIGGGASVENEEEVAGKVARGSHERSDTANSATYTGTQCKIYITSCSLAGLRSVDRYIYVLPVICMFSTVYGYGDLL
jgi:hypothetical protein